MEHSKPIRLMVFASIAAVAAMTMGGAPALSDIPHHTPITGSFAQSDMATSALSREANGQKVPTDRSFAPASIPQNAKSVTTVNEMAPVESTVDRVWTGESGSTDDDTAPEKVTLDNPTALSEEAYAKAKAAAAAVTPRSQGLQRVDVPEERAPSAPTMPTLFNGLDRPSSANNGVTFSPPDEIVGKSPNRVLEATNSAVRLFNNTGSPLATLDLNTFMGAPTTNGLLFDPKVYYDRNATNPRFYVVGLQQTGRGDTNVANDVSRIWIAVSRASDPGALNSGWCRYNVEGRRNVGTASASWADYPGIGAGLDSFSVTMNQFRFTDDAFTFAVVHVFNKTVAANNAAGCPSVPRHTFQPSATEGDGSRFTIQPAQHYTSPASFAGTTNPAYYLSTRIGSSNEYRVYRVRNVASGSPTMAQLTLTGTSYSIPADAPQPGNTVLVDTGDNRVLQAAGIGNDVLGTFTTGCNFTAGTTAESCSLSPRIRVTQTPTGVFSASIIENTFAGFSDNLFVHHPSVAMNASLQAGATWLFNGSARSLSAAAMAKNAIAPWAGVSTYAPGQCAQASNRSGDFTGAQTDPSDLRTFWLAGEHSVTISGTCQWATRIGRVVP
jgi:hypothetical protein